ncbi:phosphate regulon sensor histidine kinase PhoR [sulfur-oxidizing endosymbiont of Gigantopelta aegis]|uniref:phosphate regulon sensor histidine kinase PhoR n=1 Tax=sulfur-oxidizing endosymbiont of Gigantopelta aegis TaxID=2794934 RepID=UPI0018DC5B03|nr:phosphate regulon sensor histidine kinase PhoR [sulfur-oxidizing endosymbiont of Gigantopelta aegis]
MSQDKDYIFNEIFWVSLGLVALLLLGYAIGSPWFLFSMGLLIYIFWHLRQLTRMVQWLAKNELDMPPDASGFWGEIFRHLYRIQRHNRHRQEKLMVVLNRYKESTEAMPDATIILGRNWEIEWFNSKCESYFGLKKNQDVGQILTNLMRSPVLLAFIESQNQWHEKEGGDRQKALEMLAPDGARTLSIRLIPYGKKYLLIARDISSIQKLKTMRRDFVANVSHELRTPLTVITGYLETLDEHLREEPMFHNSIKLMQQQSNRMCHIVQDLLLLSTIESNERQNLKTDYIDMSALVMMLKKEALALSNGKHQITASATGVKWLKGDSNELQSAFSNLISNAIRYTPVEGEITIRWYMNDEQQGCFEVQDNGEGIAEEHIERLTERFYRVDVGRSRDTGGTGLGLAIVKHVVNHHYGKLTILSTLGAGSSFCCEFPQKMLKSE